MTAVQDETPTSTTSTETLRRAFVALEVMRDKLEAHERSRTEPIAIVGLGCRLPGGVVDAETYWQLLVNGVDALQEVPADRWDIDALYDTRPAQPGKVIMRTGGFLDRLDLFDHAFFGISKREAVDMDPQQRLVLEVAWEAFENAGQAPQDIAGSRTGVFTGVCTNDFAVTNFRHPLDITSYASTGTSHSAVAGRVSYLLDLRGPSVSIDTACSSSLVAVQMASQSLRSGECDLALAGGVNVMLSPLTSIAYSQFPGMVSPDGICKTFDADADGSIPSEGCGMVVLKRLSDAVRDGDVVLATVRGGAVNQDGRSSGLTAPSGMAQCDVLRTALANSGVQASEVSYVEAHGSGTPLGDPIEVEALTEVYGSAERAPFFLGTVKTNIGHLQAGAGVAGLIKVVLSMQHGVIPPNLHFNRLNPEISFDRTGFAVPTEPTPWPDAQPRKIAGVSAFAFSGTNAHIIIEEAPTPVAVPEDRRRPASVLALSARTEQALVRQVERYARRLDRDDAALEDVCFSANTGRAQFKHRLAAAGASREDITRQLHGFLDGLPGDEPFVGQSQAADVVFLFTGQGSQRPGHGFELYETQPSFRATIESCEEILRPVLDEPLTRAMFGAGLSELSEQSGMGLRLLDQARYSQPAMFALEYALAELWRSWGVEPVAVMGHSFGEYVAACVAGAMSLEDGLRLVTERGRLMDSLTGTMAVAFASEATVMDLFALHGVSVAVAAVNSPTNTVISGEDGEIARAREVLSSAGVKSEPLSVTNSGHSPLVEPMLAGLRRAAAAVEFSTPKIPVVSNVTGELWAWDAVPDADYWVQQARQTVQFSGGIATLRALGYRTFLEIGPAPTLLGLVSETRERDSEETMLPSLRPKSSDWRVMLTSLARLFVGGVNVDWKAFDRDYQRTRTAVPTYPFDPIRCWQEPRQQLSDEPRAEESRPPAGSEGDDRDLFYELGWQPAEAPTRSADAVGPGSWVILDDGSDLGLTVVERLTSLGKRCVRCARPDVPLDAESLDSDGTVVRVGNAAELAGVLERVATDEGIVAVVDLWGITTDDEQSDTADAQRARQSGVQWGAVTAVQAMAMVSTSVPSTLWLVTRGAVSPVGTDREPVRVSQAGLWGLARSVQQEHPSLWGGAVDLDPEGDVDRLADLLIAEITHHEREDQMAYRAGQRFVARLVRRSTDASDEREIVWRPDASYLVTGGLTGIGFETARSMVLAGARRLVILGRTPLPERAAWGDLPPNHPAAGRVAAVRELERLGAAVITASLDVSDEAAVTAFLGRFDCEGWPAIRGVVHSAAIAEITPMVDLTPDVIERQLRAKSVGAWVLHRVFAGSELDFFVMFGSASSVLSSPFMSVYAASNASVDALAELRRAQGQPGLSIGWGLWEGAGMAERQDDVGSDGRLAASGTVRKQLRLSDGMGTIRPERGVRVFHDLLSSDAACVLVLPIDVVEWGVRYQHTSRSALLDTLLGADAPTAAARRRTSRVSQLPSREALLAVPQDGRLAHLTDALQRSLASWLAASPDAVDPDQPLIDLGFDSLMAIEVRNEIEGRLQVLVPVPAFFSDASVRTVAAEVMLLVEGADDGAPAARAILRVPRTEQVDDLDAELLAELESLSDDEVSAAMEQAR